MATRLIAAVLPLALLNACAIPNRVRLDTCQGAPLEYRPPTSNKFVQGTPKRSRTLSLLVLNTLEALLFPPQDWLVRASYPATTRHLNGST